MDFHLTNEQQMLRKMYREFAENEVKPLAEEIDEEERFPMETVEKMAKLGMMGIYFPKEYGGAGGDVLSYAMCVEELAKVCGTTAVIVSAHTSLCCAPIFEHGTEEQKRKYLPDLLSGKKIGAFGLTEPNAGTDASGQQTLAVLEGDHYVLNGSKCFITNGNVADTFVVFAMTDKSKGNHGISAFIVEKDFPGFSTGKHEKKMGIRGSSTCDLIFEDCIVPKENLLGKEGKGFKIAMQTLDGGRIGIAAQALGIAQGAYEAALNYSKERIQFNAPICQNQGVSFKLADMATKLRAARFLVYSAAELKQEHQDYGMESAMAKMYASDAAVSITNDALQIFGGTGYLKGMDVERFYRDAKITTIYEGTNEIQRVVIASHITDKMSVAKHGGAPKQNAAITGARKKQIFKDGTPEEQVAALVEALKNDGYDFTVGIPLDTPISDAERVVSAGKGIGEKANMKLIEELARQAGAAVGSSRPVAETLQYVPIDRYVGMSGQKFNGNLYIACGISGAVQHLKGIKNATTIVAININAGAPIFKNCDYGIVGDVKVILPLLAKALNNGQPKKPAPPMVKMKRPLILKDMPEGRYVCKGCGYEYNPDLGDPDADVKPGTKFQDLPEDWVCPLCNSAKTEFVPVK